MKMSELLDPVSELAAIRLRYGLGYQQLAAELQDTVGLGTTAIYNMLASGKARRSVETAVEVWLNEVGRKRYPLRKENDG